MKFFYVFYLRINISNQLVVDIHKNMLKTMMIKQDNYNNIVINTLLLSLVCSWQRAAKVPNCVRTFKKGLTR